MFPRRVLERLSVVLFPRPGTQVSLPRQLSFSYLDKAGWYKTYIRFLFCRRVGLVGLLLSGRRTCAYIDRQDTYMTAAVWRAVRLLIGLAIRRLLLVGGQQHVPLRAVYKLLSGRLLFITGLLRFLTLKSGRLNGIVVVVIPCSLVL